MFRLAIRNNHKVCSPQSHERARKNGDDKPINKQLLKS